MRHRKRQQKQLLSCCSCSLPEPERSCSRSHWKPGQLQLQQYGAGQPPTPAASSARFSDHCPRLPAGRLCISCVEWNADRPGAGAAVLLSETGTAPAGGRRSLHRPPSGPDQTRPAAPRPAVITGHPGTRANVKQEPSTASPLETGVNEVVHRSAGPPTHLCNCSKASLEVNMNKHA